MRALFAWGQNTTAQAIQATMYSVLVLSALRGALKALTILPVQGAALPPGKSALLFPLYGAVLGLICAQWLQLFTGGVGSSMAALIVLVLWGLLTGDLVDGDLPRAAGVLGLALMTILRWQALTRLPAAPVWELAACLSVARAAMVAQAWISRPLDQTLGSSLHSITAVAVIAQGIGCCFLAGLIPGAVLLLLSAALTYLLYRWYDARDGGVSGGSLRATCMGVETLGLIVVSCRGCLW